MDVSDIFFLFQLGEGDGGVRRAGRGGWLFLNIPGGGGGSRRGRGRGAGRVSAANWAIFFLGGGGLIFFCSGPKCPHKSHTCQNFSPKAFSGGFS